MELNRSRLIELQQMLKLVRDHEVRLLEDVGSGWVDITDRSVARWQRKIADLTAKLAE